MIHSLKISIILFSYSNIGNLFLKKGEKFLGNSTLYKYKLELKMSVNYMRNNK